ncbi:restriction endonuclease subunit S [Tenacibaculum mesophilum]|uniref:restriction endonuclease subunit S n=1 Tax=Tenacibaculum mesophilum TaxID=104268 RepID=UPI00064B541B|nr:restriction endonuclease subunit S [Tenacibaculum mesophilum]
MNKEKDKIEPELRFPEFENDGGWEIKLVSKFFEVGSSKRVLQKNWTNQGVPFYRTRELVSLSKNEPFGSEIYISEELFLLLSEKYGIPQQGDFLVSGVGTLGILYQVKENDKFYFKDGNVIWFKIKEGSLVSDYFKHCFHTTFVRSQIFGQSSASTVGTYTISNARKTKFWKPVSKQEQQKIANCLSSLDNLITAEAEKLDHLKDHKKGLLQQLFPAKGETKPQFRFQEFKNDGDWEEKCVNDFFEVGSSKRVLQKDWIKEGIPFYRTRELVSLSKNEPFGSEIYISEELFLELSKKYGIPKAGDFLVSGVGTLGILYQVKENDKFYFKDGNVIWFKLMSGIVSDYFKHCFHTKFFQKQIFGQSSASTVGTYTISNARKTKFWKPIRKEEQQKIANCLSSADDLIEAQKNKIETLYAHKKGLMQQMFPKTTNI